MNPIRLLAASLLAFAVVSCAQQKADKYDTVNPGSVNAAVTEPANPVYDTPAAYEETGATSPASAPPLTTPGALATPNLPAPNVPRASANGSAIIHTVVAGDTLSGISAKYKVPAAAIRQANSMTKDTVVLGRKMVIPPVQ